METGTKKNKRPDLIYVIFITLRRGMCIRRIRNGNECYKGLEGMDGLVETVSRVRRDFGNPTQSLVEDTRTLGNR